MSGLTLPPLFTPLATAGANPFDVACREAQQGCDAGLVPYDVQTERLRAAMVFAPEVPLRDAAIMLPICGVGFQNALGALAPPEVSVHLGWAGAIRVNGAICGHLTLAADPPDPAELPDWLVVGLELALWSPEAETGHTPDQTTLFDEGCAEVDAAQLLEAWARHTLVWLNRWMEEGTRPLYTEWQGLAHGLNEPACFGPQSGSFLGVDESFGMLLQSETGTSIIPLTDLLRDTS